MYSFINNSNIAAAEDIDIDRSITCCFTGHRNKDLPLGGDVLKQGMKCLISTLRLSIEEAYRDGYRNFISGMAEGIDIICAEIVFQMKKSGKYDGIKLICALPHPYQQQEIKPPHFAYLYGILIDNADAVVILSKNRHQQCYKIRNQFMVDHSARIIGAYDKNKRHSGTRQTIGMAQRAGIEMNIVNFNENPVYYVNF